MLKLGHKMSYLPVLDKHAMWPFLKNLSKVTLFYNTVDMSFFLKKWLKIFGYISVKNIN